MKLAANLAVLVVACGVTCPAETGVRWIRDLKQATSLALESNRPMLIEFWADWCAPCKVMDQQVYSNPALAEAINGKLVPVRLHFDLQQDIARRYGVEAIPHVIFTDSYGTELMHHRGVLDLPEMTTVVRELPPDVTRLNLADRTLQQRDSPVGALLEMGRQLASAGFYEASSRFYAKALRQPAAKKNPEVREEAARSLGRNSLELRSPKEAMQFFEMCVRDFPASVQHAEDLLGLALAYTLGDRRGKAESTLRLLIASYAETEAARKAQAMIGAATGN